MHPENFVYWLQGYFEISKAEHLTAEQTEIVKQHLALVLHHVELPPPFARDVPGMVRRLGDPEAPIEAIEPEDVARRRRILRGAAGFHNQRPRAFC